MRNIEEIETDMIDLKEIEKSRFIGVQTDKIKPIKAVGFKINGAKWTIREVSKDELDTEDVIGQTNYIKQEIKILKNSKNKKRTLIHELMHVWLWEYAHPQNNEETFTFENVCEIVACSHNFINKIIKMYIKKES